ncbi:hypothetical protein BHE74_00034996 [Ensete ventricosum]|nr:hypothetical protein GW17_00040692 [Ensete ventricosum]RWW58162.1 hypothetical protein BHE74_00034996 [Ensete ventricosum]
MCWEQSGSLLMEFKHKLDILCGTGYDAVRSVESRVQEARSETVSAGDNPIVDFCVKSKKLVLEGKLQFASPKVNTNTTLACSRRSGTMPGYLIALLLTLVDPLLN